MTWCWKGEQPAKKYIQLLAPGLSKSGNKTKKRKKNCITSDHSPWFFSNGMVLTVTIWFSNRFSGFPMYMESAPELTELYWALLIHLYHCNARVRKSLLAQISAFCLQRSFLFGKSLDSFVSFTLAFEQALHLKKSREVTREPRAKGDASLAINWRACLRATNTLTMCNLYCKLLQIQKRSNANISADARQATDPIRDNLWLDRVCDQTWWSSASQSSSV